MKQALDAGGGRASVKAVAQQIAARYGEAPSDERIAGLAYGLGAMKHGDWLERPAKPRR